MEILKMGEIPKQNKIICDTCETEFLYEQGDIKIERNKSIESHMTLGGVWDDYIKTLDFYVECPLCKKHFIIRSKTESIDTLTFDEIFNGGRAEFEERIKWND